MANSPADSSPKLEILLVGLNHKTASVELRECLAFSEEETRMALEQLQQHPTIGEAVLISTCNRVELMMAVDGKADNGRIARDFLADFKNAHHAGMDEALYEFRGDEAVRHLFMVASSLDSMMVGEPQILGQIKAAYHLATKAKTSGVILNRLFHKAFFVAKRVRTETGIGDHAVSISYAAIELAKKIFGSIESKRVLLVGAGEMAELAVEHLVRNRVAEIRVANRTLERGMVLAQRFNGQAIHFDEIEDAISDVDIVVSSTGFPGYVIHSPAVKKALRKRKNRPVFFIDIAVPRDIDPKINRLSNAYVYDIDDLKGVVEENIEDRRRESIRAGRIVEEAVVRFANWYDSLDVIPTIKAIRDKLNQTVQQECAKSLASLELELTPEQEGILAKMTDAIVNKFMHDPTLFLKREGCRGDKSIYLDVARKLFNIDEVKID